jgi:hypothetical protein
VTNGAAAGAGGGVGAAAGAGGGVASLLGISAGGGGRGSDAMSSSDWAK